MTNIAGPAQVLKVKWEAKQSSSRPQVVGTGRREHRLKLQVVVCMKGHMKKEGCVRPLDVNIGVYRSKCLHLHCSCVLLPVSPPGPWPWSRGRPPHRSGAAAAARPRVAGG
jgi:hypothetical protein